MELTKADSGSTVQVPLNGTVTVALDETPGTGYRWHIDRYSESILRLRDSRFVPDPSGRPGAPGRRLTAFETHASGAGDLSLSLRRPWDDSHRADQFTVGITVGG